MASAGTVGLIGYGLLGQEIATYLKAKNYRVLVFDVKPQNQNDFYALDICSESSLATTIETLKQQQIRLDAVVNCSYPRGANYGKKLEQVSLESFNENVSLHLGGYFNAMKQFGFYLKETAGGSIISFSSVYGVTAPRFDIYDGLSFTMPVEYAAIKSAILHLNKYMAKYFKGTDVRFNSISPGGIFNDHDSKFVQAYGKYALNSEPGMLEPKELAASVEFLVSEGGRHLNGQNLVVDDGWSL